MLVVRTVIYGCYFVLLSLVAIPYCLLRPKDPRNTYLVARAIGRFGTWLFNMKIKVIHPENIFEQKKRCVYISNHQSNWDLFAFCHLVPKETVTVGKKALGRIPLFGTIFVQAGNILIHREDRFKAWGALDKAIKIMKSEVASIWIMPEGTRSLGTGLGKFKKGPFVLAIKAGVPIVPIIFNSYEKSINPNRFESARLIAEVLPPIDSSGYSLENIDQFMALTREIMANKILELDEVMRAEKGTRS